MSSTSSPFVRMLLWPSHASHSSIPEFVAGFVDWDDDLCDARGRFLAEGVPRESCRGPRDDPGLSKPPRAVGPELGRGSCDAGGRILAEGVPRESCRSSRDDPGLSKPPRAVGPEMGRGSCGGVIAPAPESIAALTWRSLAAEWRLQVDGRLAVAGALGVPRERSRPLADMDLGSPPRAVGAGSIRSRTT